jgi:hypothetical protein
MKYLIIFYILFSMSDISLANNNRRVSSVSYHHATVGTTAQDAVSPSSVDTRIVGWRLCHDPESTANYLSASVGADPAVDGIRITPGQCFECNDCGRKGLIDLNVKADAAATGYSVIQFK